MNSLHSLPANFPIDRFIGRTLAEVCFSSSARSLNFDNGDIITSYCDVEVLLAQFSDDLPTAYGKLISLIGYRVTRAKIVNGRIIHLDFENDMKIVFSPVEAPYHSYSIYINGLDYFI